MTDFTPKTFNFAALNSKKVVGSFSGGSVTSDGGLLLLREIDKKFGITNKLSNLIFDCRNPVYIEHTYAQMLRQRVYAIAAELFVIESLAFLILEVFRFWTRNIAIKSDGDESRRVPPCTYKYTRSVL